MVFGVSLDLHGELLELELSFETSRAFISGGSVQTQRTGSPGALGVSGGAVTDIVDFLLEIGGVQGSLTVARFAPGRATLSGVDSGTVPLRIKRTVGRLGYTHQVEGTGLFVTGEFRYDDYRSPRIIYTFEDLNPDAKVFNFRYVSETEPMILRTRTYGVDLALKWDPFTQFGWRFTMPIGLRFGMGGGPITLPDFGDTTLYNLRLGFLGGLQFRHSWGAPAGGTASALGKKQTWPWVQVGLRYELTANSQTLSAPGNMKRMFSTEDPWSVLTVSVAVGW